MLDSKWININKIIITPQFQESPPRLEKMVRKYNWYLKYGKFQSPIVIRPDYTLVDGYTSYLIAKKVNRKHVKVFVKER